MENRLSALFRNTFFFLGALLVGGCSVLPKLDSSAQEKSAAVKMPFETPASTVHELNPDLVFNALAGEIAMQRGEYELAYQHQLQTAILAEDAVAAERATRIAVLLKRDDLALQALEHWLRLAPNNLAGRQRAVTLYLDAGRPDPAFEQMQAILAISKASAENGFVPVMAVLSKHKDRAQALDLMQRFQAAHRDDPEAGYALALMSMVWRDYPRAESDIRKVIAEWPEWSKAPILLGRLRKLQDDGAGAINELERAIARNPNDVGLNSALARILVELNEYEKGYRQFLKVLRLAPDDSDTIYSLGVLAVQLKQYADARGYFNRLLTAGSHVDDATYYMGRIEEQNGNSEGAIDWYKRVNGGDFRLEAMARVAQVQADSGKLQEALDWIKNLRIQMPEQSVQLYLMEAKLLAEHGSSAEVLRVYANALEAHQDDHDLLYARGLYAAEIDRMDIVEHDLRRIIEHDPKNADALNALGYTFADRSIRLQEADELISKALELKPDSPAILDSMGWLQFRLGNLTAAADFLKKAFAILPDGEIGAHLGEVLWMMRDNAGAEAIWQQVLDRDADSKHVIETRKRLVR
ncbi:MAG: tetratricopeptide repeat protein [Gammaproteobacteria bacterium]|nr:tetratricopeptide repeat protein [Gammaproteobacteria bacterium]